MKRRLVGVGFVIAAAATALGLCAGSAFADTVINATYPVTGSTYLQGPAATASLGPGTLTSSLDLQTLQLTGSLSLPPTTVSFNVLGIPSTATTEFIQVGQTTGSVSGAVTNGTVTATSQVILRITDLTEAGVDIPVGSACQTVVPARITVTSPPDTNLITSFTMSGTYTIPLFNNCGLLDALAPVIDLIVPGPGNTINLSLGEPTFG